jgi:hypothetical protein
LIRECDAFPDASLYAASRLAWLVRRGPKLGQFIRNLFRPISDGPGLSKADSLLRERYHDIPTFCPAFFIRLALI